MPIETTTWSEIDVGHIVRDKTGKMWTVTDRKSGWILLSRGTDGETRAVPVIAQGFRDSPVDIYVPTENEAVSLVIDELGARVLTMIEHREHTLNKARTFRVEPVPAVARAIRDHIDMLHGVNVDDVLRRHTGTKTKPATKQTRAEALADLRAAHDAVHEDPTSFPQHFPHYHAPLGGTE